MALLAFAFLLWIRKKREKPFSKADTDPEFDKGFGLGLATLFNKYSSGCYLLISLSQIVRWGKDHAEFMFGFGIMCVWLALDHMPKETVSLIENDADCADMGYGMYLLNGSISYYQKQTKVFDLGLGCLCLHELEHNLYISYSCIIVTDKPEIRESKYIGCSV